MSDYKDTLNLPKTGFPMRANLANREPNMLKNWYSKDLYQKIRSAKKIFGSFVGSVKKHSFCMTVLPMQMAIFISVTQ